MRLTEAQYRLIESNDFEIYLADLSPSQRAMAKRMRCLGLISKRRFADGKVVVTEKGRRAWWNTYERLLED